MDIRRPLRVQKGEWVPEQKQLLTMTEVRCKYSTLAAFELELQQLKCGRVCSFRFILPSTSRKCAELHWSEGGVRTDVSARIATGTDRQSSTQAVSHVLYTLQ